MNKLEFVIAEVMPGKLNALVKNLMRQMDVTDPNEAVRRINSGEWGVSQGIRPWREQDGVIYFSVTGDGTTGSEWITRLEKKGLRISDYAKSVLRSPDFKPTNNVTTEIAVLKGMIFQNDDRSTKKVRSEADLRNLPKPNAEVACLIRELFTDKEIEATGLLWIVVMHEPIKDFDGDPSLLSVDRDDCGRWLHSYCGKPSIKWGHNCGFAFIVPQVSS